MVENQNTLSGLGSVPTESRPTAPKPNQTETPPLSLFSLWPDAHSSSNKVLIGMNASFTITTTSAPTTYEKSTVEDPTIFGHNNLDSSSTPRTDRGISENATFGFNVETNARFPNPFTKTFNQVSALEYQPKPASKDLFDIDGFNTHLVPVPQHPINMEWGMENTEGPNIETSVFHPFHQTFDQAAPLENPTMSFGLDNTLAPDINHQKDDLTWVMQHTEKSQRKEAGGLGDIESSSGSRKTYKELMEENDSLMKDNMKHIENFKQYSSRMTREKNSLVTALKSSSQEFLDKLQSENDRLKKEVEIHKSKSDVLYLQNSIDRENIERLQMELNKRGSVNLPRKKRRLNDNEIHPEVRYVEQQEDPKESSQYTAKKTSDQAQSDEVIYIFEDSDGSVDPIISSFDDSLDNSYLDNPLVPLPPSFSQHPNQVADLEYPTFLSEEKNTDLSNQTNDLPWDTEYTGGLQQAEEGSLEDMVINHDSANASNELTEVDNSDLVAPESERKNKNEVNEARRKLKEWIDSLSQENSRLKEENGNLRREISSLRRDKNNMKEENSGLTTENSRLKKENHGLQDKHDKSQAGKDSSMSDDSNHGIEKSSLETILRRPKGEKC